MRIRINASLSTAIAIATGLVVLLGYFVNIPLLVGVRLVFVRWAVILAAVGLIVGLLNLLSVHWRKVTTRQKGAAYSALLILAMLATLGIAGFFGPAAAWSLWIFNYIQVPVEASLLALLSVVLVYAAARMLRRQADGFTLLFVATVLIVLIGTAGLPGLDLPALAELRAWISQVPATAGARGLLLGIALGTAAAGLRILMGADRPYGS